MECVSSEKEKGVKECFEGCVALETFFEENGKEELEDSWGEGEKVELDRSRGKGVSRMDDMVQNLDPVGKFWVMLICYKQG